MVYEWTKQKPTGLKFDHYDLLKKIDGIEFERGQKISGHKGYFLKGNGSKLARAIQNYGINFLTNRGYTEIYTPFFMKSDVIQKTS